MAGETIHRFRIALLFSLCLVGLAALSACGPSQVWSAADLQTCAETAAAVHDQFTFPVSAYDLKWKPWTVTPGSFSISSPLNGSVYPIETIAIKFDQPPADPYVDVRKLGIYVTPYDSINLTKINAYYYEYIAAKYPHIQYSWTPKTSGQFLIIVVLHNYKPGGDTKYGLPVRDFGPASTAFVCVKIKPPSVADVNKQPVMVQPEGVYVTMPTQSEKPSDTPTPTASLTLTPTLTSTPTLTFTPTFTQTRIPPIFTRLPSSTPTDETVSCSDYNESDSCVRAGCDWVVPPIGGPGECKDK